MKSTLKKKKLYNQYTNRANRFIVILFVKDKIVDY